IEIESQRRECLANIFLDTEIEQVVAEERAGQVFRGEIAHRARIDPLIGLNRTYPVMEQMIAYRIGERLVQIVRGCDFDKAPLHVKQIVEKAEANRFNARAGADAFAAGPRDMVSLSGHGATPLLTPTSTPYARPSRWPKSGDRPACVPARALP